MALVVNGVCRYTINGTFSGRNIANVMDVRIDTTGSTVSRSAAITSVAVDMFDSWADRVLPALCNDYGLVSVSWVDLDSETGEVGSVAGTLLNPLPQNGVVAGDPLPANVALLVNKLVVAQRNQRKGRTYVCALPESDSASTAPNTVTAARVAAWQGIFDGFRDDVEQDSGPTLDYASDIAVVHITDRDAEGNPISGVSTDITGFGVQSLLATQRRRLRG